MSELKKRVRAFVVSNFLLGDDNGFAEDASFLELGIIDSTGVLELVAFLQQDFGIRVEDQELTPDNLDSVSSVVSFVERKLSASGQNS